MRGSLTGSVIGNLLLVLGFSLLFGGRGEIDRQSSFLALGLVGGTTLILLIPSIPGWDGDPDRDSLVELSIPVSIVLLVAYVALTWYSLRRHAALHIASDEEIKGWSLRLALSCSASRPCSPPSSPRSSSARSRCSPRRRGCREFFVAAVIVAIVGNAAEHGGAVVVAARGKIKLAAEIALASSAQVAVFLIPAVALLALLIEPLALAFRKVEIAALAVSVDRRVDPARERPVEPAQGRDPDRAYVGIAIAFYQAGRRPRRPTAG